MKKKITKIIAILSFAAAICVTGFTLSQNNEYKKFLEMNKRALAEDKTYTFWGFVRGNCSNESAQCRYTCPFCGYKSTIVASGKPTNVSGTCSECFNTIQ